MIENRQGDGVAVTPKENIMGEWRVDGDPVGGESWRGTGSLAHPVTKGLANTGVLATRASHSDHLSLP